MEKSTVSCRFSLKPIHWMLKRSQRNYWYLILEIWELSWNPWWIGDVEFMRGIELIGHDKNPSNMAQKRHPKLWALDF
jgi:hypothetical protein